MNTSPEGRSLIEAFEGLFLKAYRDAVGVWTIGYGHTTAAGPPIVGPGMQITEAQADTVLGNDLAAVEKNVAACISGPLEQYEFDALVSFDFNTGALAKSSVRTKINAGDKAGAMAALLLYDHAGGKVLSGLARRRQAEKLMFEGKVQPALSLAGAHTALNTGLPAKAAPKPIPARSPPDVELPQSPTLTGPTVAPAPQPAKHGTAIVALITAVIAALKAPHVEMVIGIVAVAAVVIAAIYLLWPKKGS